MSQFKRQWPAITDSSENQLKKFRTTSKDRVTCFEDLSNEIYLDIFEYIEGFALYEAFSNLNTRFENILADRSIRLKMKAMLCSADERNYSVNVISSTKDRIISLNLLDYMMTREYYLPLTIDSSFTRLESLALNCTDSNQLIPVLVGLIALPRLLSLNIWVDDELEDVDNVYEIIFNIPMLKYNSLSFPSIETSIPLPIRTNGQFSSIEHLAIDHSCTLDELIVILTYTPELRRLICTEVTGWNAVVPKRKSITMSHLTYASFAKCDANFNEMEIFIQNLSSRLKVLYLTCLRDPSYLNADRWKEIIIKHCTQLRIFQFEYQETIDADLTVTAYHTMFNRFYSSFWISRQCFFEVSLHKDDYFDDVITYSLGPHRKNGIGTQKDDEIIHIIKEDVSASETQTAVSYCLEFLKIKHRFIYSFFTITNEDLLVDIIGPILTNLPITTVNITRDDFFVGTLIRLIKYLPNVHSLTVTTLSMVYPRYLSAEEIQSLRSIANENRISRVTLQWTKDLAQVQFILDLCPRIEQLEVNCINGDSPEQLIRFILMKNIEHIPHLSLLTFNLLTKQGNLTNLLTKMIDLEQLRQNYTIQQVDNQIYLRWH